MQGQVTFFLSLFFGPFLPELWPVSIVGVIFGFIMVQNCWLVFVVLSFMNNIVALIAFNAHFQKAKGIDDFIRIFCFFVHIVSSGVLKRTSIFLKIILFQYFTICSLMTKIITEMTMPPKHSLIPGSERLFIWNIFFVLTRRLLVILFIVLLFHETL